MISNIDNLRIIFEKMNADNFNTSTSLKWTFYFFDKSKDKLDTVYKELSDHNYAIQTLEKIEEEDLWKLSITKIDIISEPEKLHKRNLAFNELAFYYGSVLYDGWDVERC